MPDSSRCDTESRPALDGATVRNFSRTIVTVLCAAALMVLAVVVTMLPFVLL